MKVRITVEENLSYLTDITVERPETMSDEEFERILDDVESSCRYDSAVVDVVESLKSLGFKVLEVTSGFPNNPDDSELEITDYDFVKE